jgi:hypothetical protein
MWKTFAYSISLLLIFFSGPALVQGQDTIPIPLKIRIGIEASGPVTYYSDKNILNEEAYISVDLDEKRSVLLDAGFLNFKYSQYNYSSMNKGTYVRAGMDFNLLKPDKSQGKYWMGIGLSYGLSRFSSETPYFEHTDYWGTTSSSLPVKMNWAHFLVVTPGVRAEIFKHFSMGWSVNLRLLVHTSSGSDLKSVDIPGFGNGTKTLTGSLSYYLVWNIPFKKINAIMQKPAPEEPDEDTDTDKKDGTNNNGNSHNSGTSGNTQNKM